MATISVCIVTYNSVIDISKCLESLDSQTYPITQIIVVDNASTDGTPDVIKSFLFDKTTMRLIVNPINVGYTPGQNQAIGNTNTDYVLILNPDVILYSDYIEKIIEIMEADRNIGSASGQLLLTHNSQLIDSAGLKLTRTRNAYDLGAGEKTTKWNSASYVFGVTGSAAIFRRRMIEDISIDGQFFDEQFFAYKEDVDVAWRAKRLGWKAYYLPSAKALHSRGWKKGGRQSIPLFVRQHSYMNRFYTLIKNEPLGWHWIVLLPQIAAIEIVKLVYILLREPALFRCLPTLWRTLPDMIRKRKAINEKVKNKQNTHFNRN